LIVLLAGTAPLSVAQTSSIPDWVKQTIQWYSEGVVSEKEFLNAIKFLIQNKIIRIDDELSEDPTLQADQVTVTKPRIKQCEILFQSYKNIGEQRFKTKYSHINYLKDCIILYKDPVWNHQGEDRYDKLYKKLTEIQQRPEQKKLSYEPTVNILSKIKVGDEKYDVKFNICAGDKKIDKAKVLIKSQIESVEYGTSKDVPENACRNYATQINAKNPENIFIIILEQVLG